MRRSYHPVVADPEISLHSIGKFATLTGLSIKSLRALDRRGVLRPAVVDSRTGYRYYHPSQVPLAEWIALLKNCGLNPEETSRMLAQVPPPHQILERYESEYRLRLRLIQRAKSRLADATRFAVSTSGATIAVKFVPTCDLCTSRSFGDYASIDPMIEELRGFMREQGLTEAGPPMLLWGERVAIGDEPDIEVAVPYRGQSDGIPRVYLRRLPPGEVVYLTSSRPRDALGADYERLFDWCFTNEYLIVGPIRAVFQDRASSTELQVPVIRAGEMPAPSPNTGSDPGRT